MSDPADQFVIHRLRAQPVEYTVELRHFVSGGEWMIGVKVNDIDIDDAEQRTRVAFDLRIAADMLEEHDDGTVQD